jgi:demethylmenaquinone methyltransferase/2-methoxy-6-polyprenyl-1,4-benzoquinol methylase
VVHGTYGRETPRDSDGVQVSDDEILEEQRRYYGARALEYDEWWERRGRYDRGADATAEWNRQVAIVNQALSDFGAGGDVLELAGGTGWWTQKLAATADRLTVIDARPETLALNRERVRRDDVSYVVADLFDWRTERTYDVVFFSFWLSHVPRSRFGAFWSLVRSCLAPGGRVFFIDNGADPSARVRRVKDPYVVEYRPDLHVRRLNDGSHYRVVKVLYESGELQSLIKEEGWIARVESTGWFLFGTAQPR